MRFAHTFTQNSKTTGNLSMKRLHSTLGCLDANKVKVTPSTKLKSLTANKDNAFGQVFTDHMITVDWNEQEGWQTPEIRPYENLSLAPSSLVFHYASECFEGMKAYKDKQGNTRLFRPDMNMARMQNSTSRIGLPHFDGDQLIALIKKYVELDNRWLPTERGYSLYLRPTMIGTQETHGVRAPTETKLFVIGCPVGSYHKTGFAAIKLPATTNHVRAWPRGTGDAKIGANYASGLLPQRLAAQEGYHQNLWLFGGMYSVIEDKT